MRSYGSIIDLRLARAQGPQHRECLGTYYRRVRRSTAPHLPGVEPRLIIWIEGMTQVFSEERAITSETVLLQGLTSAEAERLRKCGPGTLRKRRPKQISAMFHGC